MIPSVLTTAVAGGESGPMATMVDVAVAILAGVKATRMGALTSERPKALLPVGGRPFLDHQLDLLHRHGARRVVLLVGHLGEQIVEHVGDGGRFGLHVEYQFDGPRLLGTGGALRQALARLGPLFWVTWGDAYLDFDWAGALAHFVGRP